MAGKKSGAPKELSPMMRQYLEVKERYADYLLLFRVGDFYETFFDDAATISSAVNIVLTRRSNGSAPDIPMAGFPYHASEGYIARLVRKGFKVAVCEQVEDPAEAKGIVRREITDIVTPGVTYSDSILEDRHNNYLAAVAFLKEGRTTVAGIAYLDVTTAEFKIAVLPPESLRDTILSLGPAELLVSASEKSRLESLVQGYTPGMLITGLDDWMFSEEQADTVLMRQFKTHSLKGFGIEGNRAGRVAAGVVLQYLDETRQSRRAYITRISEMQGGEFMTLDLQTKRNLEIVSSMHDGSPHGSLLQVMDRTVNPMGARLIRRWLQRPLRVPVQFVNGMTRLKSCFRVRCLPRALGVLSLKSMILSVLSPGLQPSGQLPGRCCRWVVRWPFCRCSVIFCFQLTPFVSALLQRLLSLFLNWYLALSGRLTPSAGQ